MMLDAPAFKPVLTPESALGIVAKSLTEQGFPKFDVTDIKLVYTPYYVFSFDVIAQEGQSPSGKTAINAYNGDLNDFVPVLFERPLKTTKQAEDSAEIESTAISASEAKDAASSKLAAQVGLKKDTIAVTAVRKIYVPAFRIWIDVAGDTHKFEIDALLGVPTGLEALPQKPHTAQDDLRAVLDKMKTPKGWGELFSGLFSSGGGPQRFLLLGVVVLILLILVLSRQGILGGGTVSCTVADDFLGPKPFLGLGKQPLAPEFGANNTLFVQGTCNFVNSGQKATNMIANVYAKAGVRIVALQSVSAIGVPPGTTPVEKPFELRWQPDGEEVEFSFERVV
ncbi:hypothetical protein HYV43_06590 [Candidatus Micrarchaeota archaeon]|nr:hypothetical protein [Candidatus Micrarchaeota archaeon]